MRKSRRFVSRLHQYFKYLRIANSLFPLRSTPQNVHVSREQIQRYIQFARRMKPVIKASSKVQWRQTVSAIADCLLQLLPHRLCA